MRVSLPGLQFTKLEWHLFASLSEAINVFPYGRIRVRASRSRQQTANIELHVSFKDQWQSATCRVHGLRPVRYHLKTANTPLGKTLCKLFGLALGEENLNLDVCHRNGPNLSLVFQVHYPDDIVKKLH